MSLEGNQMNDDVMYEGMWWDPHQPTHRVFGRFTFSRDTGVELELHGDLHEAKAVQIGAPQFPSLLIGVTKRGYFVYVLHGCWGGTHTSRGPNSGRSIVKGQIAFVQKGVDPPCEFKKAQDVKFTKISVHFTHLDQWFAGYMNGFNEAWAADDQSIQMSYQAPSPINVSLDRCDLTFRVAYQHKTRWKKQFNMELKAMVDIKFKTPQSLDECDSVIHLVRGFITLGLGIPTYPAEIFGNVTDSQILEFLHRDKFPLRQKAFNSQKALFRLPDVQNELQTYLTNWFAQAEHLGPVYDLYFSSRYNPHQYLHSHFLSLIQALETYHRRQYGGQYMEEAEYKDKVRGALVEAIPSELDSDFKVSLKSGTLKYAYQYSLRKRLKELTKKLADDMPKIQWLETKQSRQNFVASVADVRNYLTHYDPDSDVDISPERLSKLALQIKIILEIYLLREIGFSTDEVYNLIK